MKVWLDTAKLDEIKEAVSWGVVRGVTTNPTHIAASGTNDFKAHILKIVDIVQGPVSAEVVATDWQTMVREAEEIATWSPHVVIKIPTTIDGLKAMKIVKDFGTINATLIFSPNQAYMAAAAGAHYVSPFVARLDAVGQDGMQIVRDTVKIFQNYNWPNEVVAASIRTSMHVTEAMLAGSHIVTMPFTVLKGLMDHPMTDIGLKMFLDDWAKVSSQMKPLQQAQPVSGD